MATDENTVDHEQLSNDALAAADAAGIKSPAEISETHQADLEELHLRLQVLESRLEGAEAVLWYMTQNQFRALNLGDILKAYREHKAAQDNPSAYVINPNVIGPSGPLKG